MTRPAVLYVPSGRTVNGRSWEGVSPEEERAYRERAAERGLVLTGPTARDRRDVDRLLAALPDAALLVRPPIVDAPMTSSALEGQFVLEGLLALGATLRLCGAVDPPAAEPDPRSDGTAVLLAAFSFPHAPVPGPDVLRGRQDRCEEYARSCGLDPRFTVVDRESCQRFVREQYFRPDGDPVPTVVVHPDALPPRDAFMRVLRTEIGEWLMQGRTVYSTGRLPKSQQDSAHSKTGQPFRSGGGSDSRPVGSAYPRRQDPLPGPPQFNQQPQPLEEEAYEALEVQARRFSYNFHERQQRFPAQFPSTLQTGPGPDLTRASRSPAPPTRRPGQPLPHDGLFIRRSTAFGTRSAVGLSELIDSGVLIEQEQIRFDDFVAARTGQLPGPAAGEGLAVSHGCATAVEGAKAHDRTTHFVEIALKAGEEPPAGAPGKDPLPVNFVFVVDTSSSMSGDKLDAVKSTLQEIYDRLRPTDSLGIVTFATSVSTLLQGTAKADLPPERFAAVVGSMAAYGGTDLNLGLQYGIAEIARRASSGRTVNRLYLFSDGNPNSGTHDWVTIRKNVADRMRGDLTLSCFGFGTDANMAELSALAGTARGHCTFVTRPEQVQTGLLADLARRDHLAAIDIQLRIDIDPAVTVWHLYGHDLVTDPRARAQVFQQAREAERLALDEYGTRALPDLITDEKGIRIFAPDLAFGETYWVVLELQVPEGADAPSAVGSATVQYADTVAREPRSRKLDLTGEPSLTAETVTVHAVGLRTSEVTFQALDDLYENDRPTARRRLNQHITFLGGAHRAVPAPEFVDDQVTLGKLIALADTLGTMRVSSDVATPLAAPVAVFMNDFAKVRSGYADF